MEFAARSATLTLLPAHPPIRIPAIHLPMRILLCGIMLLALVSPALAQPDPPLWRGMARAGCLVGRWEGEGWVRFSPDGYRMAGRAGGEGQAVLSGLALSWKSRVGTGDRELSENDVTPRFRRDSAAYRVTSHGPGTLEGWARAGECELSWGLQVPEGRAGAGNLIRYTLRVDAESRLAEVGERSGDGGRTWRQFAGAEVAGGSGAKCRASGAEPARTGGEER